MHFDMQIEQNLVEYPPNGSTKSAVARGRERRAWIVFRTISSLLTFRPVRHILAVESPSVLAHTTPVVFFSGVLSECGGGVVRPARADGIARYAFWVSHRPEVNNCVSRSSARPALTQDNSVGLRPPRDALCIGMPRVAVGVPLPVRVRLHSASQRSNKNTAGGDRAGVQAGGVAPRKDRRQRTPPANIFLPGHIIEPGRGGFTLLRPSPVEAAPSFPRLFFLAFSGLVSGAGEIATRCVFHNISGCYHHG